MKKAKLTQWEEDCLHWMGLILTGDYKHYCPDWDDLPIDETCAEFGGCTCYVDDPKAMALVRERGETMSETIDDLEWLDEYYDDGYPWGWDEDDNYMADYD